MRCMSKCPHQAVLNSVHTSLETKLQPACPGPCGIKLQQLVVLGLDWQKLEGVPILQIWSRTEAKAKPKNITFLFKYITWPGPVAWFCNSSYLGGRNLELLRSLSPGEVLRDLSSVRNSPVSAYLILELFLPNFAKIHNFWRCLNDIPTIFEDFGFE